MRVHCIVVSLVLALFTSGFLSGQSRISGVVNHYTQVSSIRYGCAPGLSVADTKQFQAGVRAFLIQMTGATVTGGTGAGAGSLSVIGGAGLGEFVTVREVRNSEIVLEKALVHRYDNNYIIQLVRVAFFEDATVIGELQPEPWNGTTGGVVALEVSGTLRLEAGINASSMGFSGGAVSARAGDCGRMGYVYSAASRIAAFRGAGVAPTQVNQECGRAFLANGGGGGVEHNSGGGGGGNGGPGGNGGNQWTGCNQLAVVNGGLGGIELPNDEYRTYLGGGGGGGQQNDMTGTAGGQGGGIIIIRASILQGNDQTIESNGQSVHLHAQRDGAGGGGAGGSIFLEVPVIEGNLTVVANGGRGGNIGIGAAHGPGGGGGGGRIYLSRQSLPEGASVFVLGGVAGINEGQGGALLNHGARPGSIGYLQYGVNLRENRKSDDGKLILVGPTPVCAGSSVEWSVQNAEAGTVYTWTDDKGLVIGSGTRIPIKVQRTVRINVVAIGPDGCRSSASRLMEVAGAPNVELTSLNTVADKCDSTHVYIIKVTNKGSADVIVSDVIPYGPSAATYEKVGAFTQSTLSSGGEVEFHFRMRDMNAAPLNVGVVFAPCGDTVWTTLAPSHDERKVTLFPDMVKLVGPLCLPYSKDTVIQLINETELDLTVLDKIENGCTAFISTPLLVPAGDTLEIPIRMHQKVYPQSGNLHLNLSRGQCFSSVSVNIEGAAPFDIDFEIDTLINLGTLTPCDVVTGTLITIKASGTTEVMLTAESSAPSRLSVEFPSMLRLLGGQTGNFVIRYQPNKAGFVRDTIFIAVHPCSKSLIVVIEANVIGLDANLTESLSLGTTPSCLPFNVQTAYLSNHGDESITLDLQRISVTPPFSLTGDLPPATVLPGESAAFFVTAARNVPGMFTGNLSVVVKPCDTKLSCELFAEVQNPALDGPSYIDLGAVDIGDIVDTSIVIRNSGPLPLNIAEIQSSDPFLAVLRTYPDVPTILAPDALLLINVRFSVRTTSPEAFITLLADAPCTLEHVTLLSADGTVPTAQNTTIQTPVLKAKVGSVISVPVYLLSNYTVGVKPPQDFKFSLFYPTEMLAITKAGNGTTAVDRTDSRLTRIDVEGTWDGNPTLWAMDVMVLLQPSDFAPVSFSTAYPFTWINRPLWNAGVIDGGIEIRDICIGLPKRSITFGIPLRFQVTSAMPAGDEIHFNMQADAERDVNVSLIELATGRVRILANISGGSMAGVISLSDVGTGSYMIRVDADTEVVVLPLSVIR